ncbi:MAG: hypothetical protein NZM31_00220 [Gemmatales bacterium]|nr:hypothetical protein [Gemmatales bacterium]MDW8385417.1 hypothetical protein [Gemmatales bacterium]
MEEQAGKGLALFEEIQKALVEMVGQAESRLHAVDDALVEQSERQVQILNRFKETEERFKAAVEVLRGIRATSEEAVARMEGELAALEAQIRERVHSRS